MTTKHTPDPLLANRRARGRRLTNRLARALGVATAVSMAVALAVACDAQTGRVVGGDSSNDTSGGQGGFLGFDGGIGSGGDVLDEDSACATASDEAKLVPVNMYIMFDKSGSMQGTKWSQTTAAMGTFFSAPESGGLRVALSFFPDDGCGLGDCNAAACAQPQVPLAELIDLSAPTDTQEQLLLDALGAEVPGGATPTSAALDGAHLWAQNYLAMNPFEKAVVVLVTDGEPTECTTDQSYLVSQTATAFGTHEILTFAVGLFLEGAEQDLMNNIAAAGGTTEAIFVDTANAQEEFLAALNAIKESAVACEFLMPEGEPNSPIDPSKVNVIYKPGDGGEDVIIGQVPNEASCTAAQGGWYYDNPSAPTTIILCPSTCAAIQADENAEIEILLGCTTIPV